MSNRSAISDRAIELLESRLTAADMMRIFEVKAAAFYHQLRIGRYDAFELKPRIGRTRFWSAKKVQAYLDGEGTAQRISFKRSA